MKFQRIKKKRTGVVDVKAMLKKTERKLPIDKELMGQIRKKEITEKGPILLMGVERLYDVKGPAVEVDKKAKEYLKRPNFHESRNAGKVFLLCGVIQKGKETYIISPATRILYKRTEKGFEKVKTYR